MKKIVIIICVMILCIGTLSSQPIAKQTTMIRISNYFTGQEARYTHITMENTTDEDYYFWIGHGKTAKQDSKALFHKYFYRRPDKRYSFSFGGLQNDMNIIFTDYEIQVGYNFIKLLKPHEKFEVIIRNGGKKKPKFYEERFAFVPVAVVCEFFGHPVEEFFLYTPSAVVLE